jgi:hypothetical protein
MNLECSMNRKDDGTLWVLGATAILAGATALKSRGSRAATEPWRTAALRQARAEYDRGATTTVEYDDLYRAITAAQSQEEAQDILGVARYARTGSGPWHGSSARSNPIAVGDRVQYKAAFLRSISEFTGPLPFAKGTVTEINKLGSSLTIATIDWGDDEIPPRVNVANLKRIKDWEPN